MKRVGICFLLMMLLIASGSWAAGTAKALTLIESLNPQYSYPTKPIKLVLWDFWEGERPLRVQYERKLAAEYQVLHPNVSIEIVGIPVTDYETKYRIAIDSGTGPDVVVIQIADIADWGWDKQKDQPKYGNPPPSWLLGYMQKVLRPQALLQGSIISPLTGKRVYWGVNTQADGGLLLYYNKTLFAQAGLSGPPTTAPEMVDFAKKLSQYDAQGNLTRAGFAMRYKGGWNVGYKAFPFLWAFTDGTHPFLFTDDYLDTRIDSPPYVAAISAYQSLITKLKLSSPLLPDADASMLTGLGAMSFREAFFWGQVTTKAPQYQFGIAPAPNGAPPYGNYKVGTETAPAESFIPVTNDSQKTDIAFDFVAYIQLVPEHDLEITRLQGITPLVQANMDSEYARNLPVANVLKEYQSRPVMQLGQSPYGVTNQVETLFGKSMEVILSQGADVATTMKATADQIRTVIKNGVAASK
jgi:multiple sugar transport system substrate-binding protein